MSALSLDEVNLQRLLFRTKKLCMENLEDNLSDVKTSVVRLAALFSRLQDDRLLKLKIEFLFYFVETPIDRLKCIDLIPNVFPQQSYISEADQQCEQDIDNNVSLNFEKARNKAIYTADLRKQLLGGTERYLSYIAENEVGNVDEVIQRESGKQEELAEELRTMAILMKNTYVAANGVIKQDNVTLNRLQETAERNQSRLEVENRRLAEHAYRSWCDCMYIFGVVAVVASFIAMSLVMRIFKKRY
uniref:Vesicle transport protein USE1 n=1 Tax=Syphacia muris TaxID=451379 RepID=A0A0N5AQ15_9BILA